MTQGTNVSLKKKNSNLRCKTIENFLKKVLYSHLSSKYQKTVKFLLMRFSITKVTHSVATLLKSPRNILAGICHLKWQTKLQPHQGTLKRNGAECPGWEKWGITFLFMSFKEILGLDRKERDWGGRKGNICKQAKRPKGEIENTSQESRCGQLATSVSD